MQIYTITMAVFIATSLISATRYKNLVRYVNIAILTATIAFNYNLFDYDAYERMFQNPELYSNVESGYRGFLTLLRTAGFDDSRIVLFLLAIATAYTLIRVARINDIDSLNSLVLLFYPFAFVYFVIQLRNSFALLFLINSLVSLVKNRKGRAIIEAIIAVGFHLVAGWYVLIFFFLYLLYRERIGGERLISIKSVIFVILITLLGYFYPRLISLVSGGSFGTLGTRIDLNINNYRGISAWVIVTIIDVTLFYFVALRGSRRDNSIENSATEKAISVFYLILLVEIPTVFLLSNFNEFGRIYRDMFLIKAILCSLTQGHIDKSTHILLCSYVFASGLLFILRIGINLDNVFMLGF